MSLTKMSLGATASNRAAIKGRVTPACSRGHRVVCQVARPHGERMASIRPTAVATSEVTITLTETLVQPVSAETLETVLTQAGEKLVVIDWYTDWCGPCKMIAPELERMAEEFGNQVSILKLNCTVNDDNKKLAIAHGIKALPTFHLYRNAQRISEMTGAKAKNLRKLIVTHL